MPYIQLHALPSRMKPEKVRLTIVRRAPRHYVATLREKGRTTVCAGATLLDALRNIDVKAGEP